MRQRGGDWLKRLVGVAVVAAGLLNAAAFMHARAMMHYVRGGERTQRPEALGALAKLRTLIMGVNIPRPMNDRIPSAVGLPFETRSVAADEGSLEVWVTRRDDDAPWVVLFHGYAASKAQVLTAARRFYDLGFSLLLVDLRGSGGSSGNQTSIGYYEARDVATAVRWVAASLAARRPVLYGFSMGAAAVLRAVATERVHPAALVLEAVFDRMLTTVEHRFASMGVPSFPAARLLVFWGGVAGGFDAFGHNPADYASHVECPTLMLQGEHDPRVTVANAGAVYARLSGPKRLYVARGLGHEVTDGLDAQQWQRTVGGFLRAHGALHPAQGTQR